MTRRLRALLPGPQRLVAVRGFGWIRPLAARRDLWRLERRRVALGVAIGAFFGILLPLGQTLPAVALAIFVRANLPVAVLGTFVSNPLTIAPLYAGAYAAGAALLGMPVALPEEGLAAVGKPLLIGTALLALAAAAAAWLITETLWRVAARRRAARWSSIRKTRGQAS
jgi:uncharacterized protein (DUF2062 family)